MTDVVTEHFPKTNRDTLREYVFTIVAKNQQETAEEVDRSRPSIRRIKDTFADMDKTQRKKIIKELVEEDPQFLQIAETNTDEVKLK